MAKQPNAIALSFTTFLISVKPWRYTPFGLEIITLVKDASPNVSTVTDTEYNEYSTYTNFRYQRFLMHVALTE